MPSTLPSYSVRPEYMPADTHCALCFHVCPMPSPPLESRPEHRGVHPAVVAHAQEYHGLLDADAYRRAVLARVQVEWPVPVSAQVQRMSVDRYLDRLRDDNYTTSLCACCACVEFAKDLMECEFPLRSCTQKPSWAMVDGGGLRPLLLIQLGGRLLLERLGSIRLMTSSMWLPMRTPTSRYRNDLPRLRHGALRLLLAPLTRYPDSGWKEFG